MRRNGYPHSVDVTMDIVQRHNRRHPTIDKRLRVCIPIVQKSLTIFGRRRLASGPVSADGSRAQPLSVHSGDSILRVLSFERAKDRVRETWL